MAMDIRETGTPVTLPCEGYVAGVAGSAKALDEAEARIKSALLAFEYEKQM